MSDSYFFVWDRALPATDLLFELVLPSLRIFEAFEATFFEVCFLLMVFTSIRANWLSGQLPVSTRGAKIPTIGRGVLEMLKKTSITNKEFTSALPVGITEEQLEQAHHPERQTLFRIEGQGSE